MFANNQAGTAFSQVTMTGNRTATYGGAIDTSSDGFAVSVERSTLADNTAGNDVTSGYGGGIYTFDGVLTVENSTITDNHALQGTDSFHSLGGGIYIEGYTLGLRYSTITGNRATRGGGVWSESNTGSIVGTILTGNRRPGGARQECLSDAGRPVLHSLGGNVLGQKACVTGTRSGDKVGKKPRLHTLEDNGGPTMTMALSAKSPAVGIATYLPDHRPARPRPPVATTADAGAFELPKVKKQPDHQGRPLDVRVYEHVERTTATRVGGSRGTPGPPGRRRGGSLAWPVRGPRRGRPAARTARPCRPEPP